MVGTSCDVAFDFDWIYDEVFLPAVSETRLPEGGVLTAHRTDRDFFAGDISSEMFGYLEYSRIAGGYNFPKQRASKRSIRRIRIHEIWKIESLCTKFNALTFPHSESS